MIKQQVSYLDFHNLLKETCQIERDFCLYVQIILFSLYVLVQAEYEYDLSATTRHPQPYSFAFTAGRYPGHIDRTRAEYGDDNGPIVRGK